MIIYETTLINKIEKAKKGDVKAFEEIYKIYNNYVYSIVRDFFNGHVNDGEDLVQEIFIKAYKNLSQLKKTEAFPNWLAGITLNVCREHIRDKNFLKNKGTLVPIEDYEIEDDEKYLPDSILEEQFNKKAILQAIDNLPSRQRLIMLLFYFQDYSYKEIAKSLDISVSAVKVSLHKGRNTTKGQLELSLGVVNRRKEISYGMIFAEYGNAIMTKNTLPSTTSEHIWDNVQHQIKTPKAHTPLKIAAVFVSAFILLLSGFAVTLLNSEHSSEPRPIATFQAVEAPSAPIEKTWVSEELPPEQVGIPGTYEKSPEIKNTAFVNGKPTNTVARTFESETGGNDETPSWKNIVNTLPKTGGTRILILAFLLIGLGLMIQNKLNKLKQSEKRRKTVKNKKWFKKIGLWASIFAIVISAMVGSFSNGVKAEEIPPVPVTPATTAVDYSDQVEVLDWDILDANGVPLSITNEAKYYETYQLKVSWSLSPENGNVFHEGDTVKMHIPTNETFGGWSAMDSSFEVFTNSEGIILGEWKINGGYIEIVLGHNIEGSSSVNATFLTGKNALRNSTTKSLTQNVSFVNINKIIKFKGNLLGGLTNLEWKSPGNTSNSVIQWGATINNIGAIELSNKTWGTSFTTQKNVYFEDSLQGKYLNNLAIWTAIQLPIDLDSGKASSNYYGVNVVSSFTKVQQEVNESYEDFKSRLQPLQYGIYTNSDNEDTVVVYFGDIGNNGLKYTDVSSDVMNAVASYAIYNGYYSEESRDELVSYFTQTYGNSNVINGQIARFLVGFNQSYDKVLVDTPKTNIATITKNGIATQVSATGTLQGNMGSASVSKNSAGVFLYDQDTNALLPNATFKVQYKNGANWEDYTSAGTLTTDANGAAVTPALGLGTYRFVEVTPSSSDYDLVKSQGYDVGLGTVISGEFTIAATDVDGHKIPVSNVKKKYSVTYTKGAHGIFTDVLFSNIVINSVTPEYNGMRSTDNEPLGETGYHFIGWDKTLLSTVTKDEVYTAQWDPNDYPITYVLDGGTNDSANPSTYTYGVGVDAFDNPTKAGYEFTGWYDAAIDGTEITNISTTATGEKTLYARWIAEDYPINYILDGGTNDSTNPNNYTYGIGVDSFKDPTKMGYTFLGWYPSETDETLFTCILPTDQGEKTLYARWEKIADVFTSEKTVDIPIDKTVKAGDIMTYTIKTENSGVLDSDAVTISDTIPEGTTYVEGSATEGAVFDGTKLTLTKDSLAPGETLTLTFKVKVKEGVKTGDTITNVAKVNDQDTNQVETPAESSDVVVPGTKTVTTPEITKDKPSGILPKTGGYILMGLGLLLGLVGIGLLIALKRRKKIVQ